MTAQDSLSLTVESREVIRTFSCADNPLDIFDGYVLADGIPLRSSRGWFGQGVGKYGEWLNSKVIFQGVDLDYGDDPRPFLANGKICLLANLFTVEHGFRNHLIEFSSPGRWSRYFLMPPSMVSPGKNWSPFSFADGCLGFIHSFSPLRILREIKRESGIILFGLIEGQGIASEEGDGHGYPAHRGGSNGVMIGRFVYGIGHTTKVAQGEDGGFVINPGCFYAEDRQLIHRPFGWRLDLEAMAIVSFPIIGDWDAEAWIIDPTSLYIETDRLVFYTTEVDRSFVDPSSRGRTVRYKAKLLDRGLSDRDATKVEPHANR